METAPPPDTVPLPLHASCVAIAGRGLLILGPSGAGKSSLALRLMALGAGLVADDITLVVPDGETLVASCPPTGRGLIEARGVGILQVPAHPPCPLALAVDLGRAETERLPPRRSVTLAGRTLRVLHDPRMGDNAAIFYHYVQFGPRD